VLTTVVSADEAIDDLARERVDTTAALRSGRLAVTGAGDAYLTGGRFDAEAVGAMVAEEVRRARQAGFAALRALGDMAWATRDVPGSEHLPRYERHVNRLYAGGYAMGVCLYDRRLFAEPRLSELARAHPATVTPRAGRIGTPLLRMVRVDAGLRLSGEADLSNRDALATVLTHLLDDSPAPVVTLDLTDLRFADATSCELIVQTARGSAGRLRAVGVRPSLRRLLCLQGAASVPGLLDDDAGQTPVG